MKYFIIKILGQEFMTAKVSENLNSMRKCQYCEITNLVGTCFQKSSNVWKNRTLEKIHKSLENKSITSIEHRLNQ